jgi:hypothetical protein
MSDEGSFHKPVDLAGFKRRGAIVRGAGFEGVQPFFGLRNPGYNHERQAGALGADGPKQFHILRRFAAGKNNVGVDEVPRCNILILVFDLMPFDRERAADLTGGGLLEANENYLCHAVLSPFDRDEFEPGIMTGLSGMETPVTPQMSHGSQMKSS